jgi:hypothetical protein
MEQDLGKVKISAFEFTMLMGGADPCLSDSFKDAMDKELLKPEYKELSFKKAWPIAARRLIAENSSALDPNCPSDMALKKLLPLMSREDGKLVHFKEIKDRLEIPDVAIVFHDKGKKADIKLCARDSDGEEYTSRFSVKMKPRKRDRRDRSA